MPSVSLSFKIHIPYRIQKIIPVTTRNGNNYFDATANRTVADKFADECYLPANKILLSLIKKHKGKFRIAFSISGTAIEILQEHRPEVIRSFQQLAETGCVDFFAETYYHSLSWLHCRKEFIRQVEIHHELIKELFSIEPAVFRNTELIYDNELAKCIASMGYKGILCEGLDRILNRRTPNQTYAAPDTEEISVLLRNVRLSDDIAFRFDDQTWNEQPLTAEKYAGWIHSLRNDACNVNLFFDYETFGIHKKADTGIFGFLEYLPAEILKSEAWRFLTPAEVADTCYPKDLYNVPQTISWEDQGKLCCVWCENMMQNNTLRKIYSIESIVKQSQIPGALECWGRLQSADHFYFMCNNGRQANDTYRLLNPFENPEAAYENYRNAVMDFEIRLIQNGLAVRKANQKTGSTANIYSSIF